MATNNIRLKAGEADTGSAVSFILDQVPVLSTSGAILLSVRNNNIEKLKLDKDGKLFIGGTPSYSPQPTAGLVANYSLVEIGNGTSQIGLEFMSGNSGAYISDGSLFWINFEKTAGAGRDQVRLSQQLTFSNNVGIINTSQANGAAGAGSPSLKINALNNLFTAGDRLLSIWNNSTERFYIEHDGTVYPGAANLPAIYKSREDDGATSTAHVFDTVNSLTTAGSRLLRIKNNNATIMDFGVSAGGYGFFSNLQNVPGVHCLDFVSNNDMTQAPDTSLVSFYNQTNLQAEIDPFGNYISTDGLNVYSKATDADPGYASGVITISNNTFDSGDTVTFACQGRGSFSFTETTHFAIGVDATATATNLKNAINARAVFQDLVIATSIGAAVTIKARFPGSLGNKIHLYKTDGATTNFTLSGLNLNNRFTGGTDAGTGLIVDTASVLTNDPDRKLFALRNTFQEKFSVSPRGGVNYSTVAVATSANTTGETIYGCTAAGITVTIDQDDEVVGRKICVKDESGAVNPSSPIVIDTESTALIDGSSSVSIIDPYGFSWFYFRNGNWWSC